MKRRVQVVNHFVKLRSGQFALNLFFASHRSGVRICVRVVAGVGGLCLILTGFYTLSLVAGQPADEALGASVSAAWASLREFHQGHVVAEELDM